MNDPDLGEWHYGYNALGKLQYQYSGNKGYKNSDNASYYVYDVLGRLIRTNTYNRNEYNKNHKYFSYNYKRFKYGLPNAKIGSRGKVIEVYASSKTLGRDWQAQKIRYSYDNLGRKIKEDNYIYKRGNYQLQFDYDAYSRLKTLTYPNGYKITYNYKNGYLQSVKK